MRTSLSLCSWTQVTSGNDDGRGAEAIQISQTWPAHRDPTLALTFRSSLRLRGRS